MNKPQSCSCAGAVLFLTVCQMSVRLSEGASVRSVRNAVLDTFVHWGGRLLIQFQMLRLNHTRGNWRQPAVPHYWVCGHPLVSYPVPYIFHLVSRNPDYSWLFLFSRVNKIIRSEKKEDFWPLGWSVPTGSGLTSRASWTLSDSHLRVLLADWAKPRLLAAR